MRVHTTNNYHGVFLTDTLDLTSRLAVTVSGRFNSANITLRDQIGTDLNGEHVYNRFNPAAGLTCKLLPSVTAYVGYSEANRAPTPAELSCASPAAPCSLTNFFVGDPDLKQVVAHTVEAGLRGKAEAWTDTKVTLVRWVFPYRQRRRHPPTTGSYGVLNVHTAYQVTPKVQLFGLVENALNSRNETYGTFSPVGPDTPILQVPNASNTRSLSPAPPIGGYGGIRVTF